jgi:hypothetical protein
LVAKFLRDLVWTSFRRDNPLHADTNAPAHFFSKGKKSPSFGGFWLSGNMTESEYNTPDCVLLSSRNLAILPEVQEE